MQRISPQTPGLHSLGLSSSAWIHVSSELFQNPQLSQYISSELSDVILKCMVKVDPKKPAIQLFYSFYKNNELVQDRSHNPVFSTEVKEENSGHYQCVVDTEDGIIQKKSGYLDIEFWSK